MSISFEGVPSTAKVEQGSWTQPVEFLALHKCLKGYHSQTKDLLTQGGSRDPEKQKNGERVTEKNYREWPAGREAVCL